MSQLTKAIAYLIWQIRTDELGINSLSADEDYRMAEKYVSDKHEHGKFQENKLYNFVVEEMTARGLVS